MSVHTAHLEEFGFKDRTPEVREKIAAALLDTLQAFGSVSADDGYAKLEPEDYEDANPSKLVPLVLQRIVRSEHLATIRWVHSSRPERHQSLVPVWGR